MGQGPTNFTDDEPVTETRGQPANAAALSPRASARLVVLSGPHRGRQWTLGPRVGIGRSSASAVCLDDALVSRDHATITLEEQNWVLRDLGSRNGTLLNGHKLTQATLRWGDRIGIGASVLLFAHVDPAHERLLERQKIESLGRLGAGIAHDLNNYFGAIIGALDYLDQVGLDRTMRDADVRECLDDVRTATRRGADLTHRLLAFARQGGAEPTTIEVGSLCNEVIEIARRTFDRGTRLELSSSETLYTRGDRSRLHQVFMNLLVNARDAMPQGGTVRVRIESAPPITGEVEARVLITVQDEGVGIDDATRARMFEPFFTTKPADKGSGLGLAIALDVITAHGGTIDCESGLGRGTTFRVMLPAQGPRTSRPPVHTVQHRPRTEAEVQGTVLVVDDEPVVRRAVGRLLARIGLTVAEASDGQKAVDEVTRDQARLDVVLMDLDMPELDGESALLAIRRLAPGLPVVILSGLCDTPRRHRLLEAGAHAVLEKPCDSGTLRQTIRSAVEARRSLVSG